MFISPIVIIGAYLIGSIASAVIVCRAMGLPDPRTQGSGNPGATNVLRLHGRLPAALTLAGDVAKGLLPVLIARALALPDIVLALTAVAAFCGHLYPVFFRFRGGKGVATLIGVLLGLHWALGLAFIGTWLVMAALFRYSSLSALTAALLTPLYTLFILPGAPFLAGNSAMAALLIWRHRSNIRNLLDGTEDKFGDQGSGVRDRN
jgi:glycerol-3-phosphate acyltransferase PlsY